MPCAASCALADERRYGTNAKRLGATRTTSAGVRWNAWRCARQKKMGVRNDVEWLASCKRPAPRAHARTHARTQPLGRMDAFAADETRSAAAAGFERDREARCPSARGVCAPAARARPPWAQAALLCMREHLHVELRNVPYLQEPAVAACTCTRMESLRAGRDRVQPPSLPASSEPALASRFKRARPRFPLQASRRAAL